MSVTATRPRRALDLDFVVATEVPLLTRYLDEAFTDLPAGGDHPQRYELRAEKDGFAVLGPDGTRSAAPDPGRALVTLVSVLNQAVIAASSSSALLLHAAGVEGAGGAVLLPAVPTAGKSTLAAALTRRGWRYLSDEVVAVDPVSLEARPYPRPVTLKRGSWAVLADLRPEVGRAVTPFLEHRWLVAPNRLGPDPVARGGPVAGISVPQYEPGAAGSIEARGRADSLQSLVGACFNLDRWGRTGFAALAEVVRRADCTALTSGDLEATCVAFADRYDTLRAP